MFTYTLDYYNVEENKFVSTTSKSLQRLQTYSKWFKQWSNHYALKTNYKKPK